MTDRIRTIGISILGGNSGVEGRYELGLDVIKAVNEVIQTGCFLSLSNNL